MTGKADETHSSCTILQVVSVPAAFADLRAWWDLQEAPRGLQGRQQAHFNPTGASLPTGRSVVRCPVSPMDKFSSRMAGRPHTRLGHDTLLGSKPQQPSAVQEGTNLLDLLEQERA